MQRPTGVTILAILHFLGAGLLLLAAAGLILMGAAGGAMMKGGDSPGAGAFIAGLGVVGGVIVLCLAALNGLVGWGLWALKNWARIISLIFCGLSLLGALPTILGALTHFNILIIFFTVIKVGITLLIVWYLMQDDVKRAFGA